MTTDPKPALALDEKALAALQALAEKATPGPWDRLEDVPYMPDNVMIASVEKRIVLASRGHPNTEFIVAARQAVPALISELLAARAELALAKAVVAAAGALHFCSCDRCRTTTKAIAAYRAASAGEGE